MSFNLIHENWIPVRREDGGQVLIAPWQITEKLNPIMALDAPRPGFNGVPRVRGDEPRAMKWPLTEVECSPRARG